METCNLCQSPLTKTLPFGPLIALLGTCPKEVAGNLGGSIMQRPVPQSTVQNGRKCGHGLRQPGLSREGDSVAANPGAGRTRNNGLVYVLMLCGQTGPHRLISPTCPRSLGIPGAAFSFLWLFPGSPPFLSWRKLKKYIGI